MMKKFYVAGEVILTEKDRGIMIGSAVNSILYNEHIYNAFLDATLDLGAIEVFSLTEEERANLFKEFRKYCIEEATKRFDENYPEIEINLEYIPEDIKYIYYNFNTDEIVFDKEEQIETIVNTLDTDETFEEWINNKYTAYELFNKEFMTDEINKEFYDSIYQEAETIFDKTYTKINLTKLRAF